VVSLLASHYGRWLLGQAAEGIEVGFSFLADLREFARWLMRGLAHRFSGRARYHSHEDYDEMQPELFGG